MPKTNNTLSLQQDTAHLAALLDALWHLTHAELPEHASVLLLECQLRARKVAAAVDEIQAPLNFPRAA